MAKRYELSDAQWVRIAELLPGKRGDRGRIAKDNGWSTASCGCAFGRTLERPSGPAW
jgi:transposase